jgi:hypothetical protein
MMKALLFGLMAVGATAASAQAAPTTFTFDASTKGQTSIIKSLDGIVMTLNNFTAGPQSGADSDGLAVYCDNSRIPCDNPYSSYEMTFDVPVKLLSYNVSYIADASDSTTFYTQGALQSIQPNTANGLVAFTNPFLASANAPITVATNDPNGTGLIQINQFTVEYVPSPTPVPGPVPLAGAAAAFSWSRRLRDRIRRSPLV